MTKSYNYDMWYCDCLKEQKSDFYISGTTCCSLFICCEYKSILLVIIILQFHTHFVHSYAVMLDLSKLPSF